MSHDWWKKYLTPTGRVRDLIQPTETEKKIRKEIEEIREKIGLLDAYGQPLPARKTLKELADEAMGMAFYPSWMVDPAWTQMYPAKAMTPRSIASPAPDLDTSDPKVLHERVVALETELTEKTRQWESKEAELETCIEELKHLETRHRAFKLTEVDYVEMASDSETLLDTATEEDLKRLPHWKELQ